SQVEKVQQVRGAGDQSGRDHQVRTSGGKGSEGGGGSRARGPCDGGTCEGTSGDAQKFGSPGGQAALRQRPQMAAQSLVVGAGGVIVPGTQHCGNCGGQGRGGTAAASGSGRCCRGSAGGRQT